MARRPRNLSTEEENLWSRVAANTNPLRPGAPAIFSPNPKPTKPTAPVFSPRDFQIGSKTSGNAGITTDLKSDISDLVGRTPPTMDRKAFRKLQRGKIRPEARIDLHGMTLAQAHPALIGFILSSHAAGRRLVLVITGKGRGGERGSGPIPERKGILREQVPAWLGAPPCKSAVIQIAQAHQSHGGGGAYYVYLRRKS